MTKARFALIILMAAIKEQLQADDEQHHAVVGCRQLLNGGTACLCVTCERNAVVVHLRRYEWVNQFTQPVFE